MVALYARVSTEDQETDNQIHVLKEWADKQNVRYRVYEEKASAKGVDRVALQKMMRKVDEGKYKAVVVWKIDRFSRSMRDFVKLFERMQKGECGLVAISQGIDTRDGGDANSRMVINLMMVFAEWEREMIVERTKLGMQRARREGKKIGRPKIGFDIVKAYAMWVKGRSVERVAKKMGVSKSVMGRRLKEFKDSMGEEIKKGKEG